MREKEAAKKAAKNKRQKEARYAAKAIQLPQTGKRKASQSTAPRKKQNLGVVGVQRSNVVLEPPLAPRTHTTRSGRTATLYK